MVDNYNIHGVVINYYKPTNNSLEGTILQLRSSPSGTQNPAQGQHLSAVAWGKAEKTKQRTQIGHKVMS